MRPADLDQLKATAAIKAGITAAEEGRVKPARTALAELQEKLGIPDQTPYGLSR